MPEHVIPVRMRREACHNGLAQLAKVVREAGHLGARDPGVDEQHAGPALYDDGVVLEQLALVDQHTFRDLRQHGAPSACVLQPLVRRMPRFMASTLNPMWSGVKVRCPTQSVDHLVYLCHGCGVVAREPRSARGAGPRRGALGTQLQDQLRRRSATGDSAPASGSPRLDGLPSCSESHGGQSSRSTSVLAEGYVESAVGSGTRVAAVPSPGGSAGPAPARPGLALIDAPGRLRVRRPRSRHGAVERLDLGAVEGGADPSDRRVG